jgi:hypothetical protein
VLPLLVDQNIDPRPGRLVVRTALNPVKNVDDVVEDLSLPQANRKTGSKMERKSISRRLVIRYIQLSPLFIKLLNRDVYNYS